LTCVLQDVIAPNIDEFFSPADVNLFWSAVVLVATSMNDSEERSDEESLRGTEILRGVYPETRRRALNDRRLLGRVSLRPIRPGSFSITAIALGLVAVEHEKSREPPALIGT
jgi:hypothetical protein